MSCRRGAEAAATTPDEGGGAAEIEFKREWALYDIKGRTYADLRRQLNEVGPLNPETRKRFDARTDWNLNWDYQYQ